MKFFLARFVSFFLPLKLRISLYFYIKHGYKMNWANPVSLSQKVQLLKLSLGKDQAIFADKLLVREYVKDVIGEQYLIPILDTLDSDNLANLSKYHNSSVVAKTNHGSGSNHICFFPNDDVFESIRKLRLALKERYIGSFMGERHYNHIKPKVIIEKKLLDSGSVPPDFKFHVFRKGDSIRWLLQIDVDRFSAHKRNFYNEKLELLDLEVTYSRGLYDFTSTDKIYKMAELAKVLSKPFVYSRIDFYLSNGLIFFGEITLSPGSGFEKFEPKKYDFEFGELLP